jgi:hypothetical protein
MDIKQFAEKYKVKTKRDGCDDTIIAGKHGHVYEGFDSGRLGVCFMFGTPKKWNRVRKSVEAAGMKVTQNAHTEGCATFDPANTTQARLAVKLSGIKTRRIASPAQLAILALARERRKMALQFA